MQASALSSSFFAHTYDDEDDLKSVRRFLKRILAPDSDTPYIYIEPLEAEFMRPAVTIELVTTRPVNAGGARNASWDVEHTLTVRVYDEGREATTRLGERVWLAFTQGGADGAAFRIPMWAFAAGGARLSRFMRVSRDSLSMGNQQTDDESKWVRPIDLRVRSPRVRPISARPTIQSATFNP